MNKPAESKSEAKVWTCDGCSSWTDGPITREELLRDWYWTEGKSDDPGIYCPNCS